MTAFIGMSSLSWLTSHHSPTGHAFQRLSTICKQETRATQEYISKTPTEEKTPETTRFKEARTVDDYGTETRAQIMR